MLFALIAYAFSIWTLVQPEYSPAAPEEGLFVRDHRVLEGYTPRWDDSGDLLIPVTLLTERLDFDLHWEVNDDATSAVVIWTAPTLLLEARTGDAVARLNDAPIDLIAPSRLFDGQPHLPAKFISTATGIGFRQYRDPMRVVIDRPGDTILVGAVREPELERGSYAEALRVALRGLLDEESVAHLRVSGDPKAAFLLTLEPGEEVEIVGEESGWYRVFVRGVEGYLPVSRVQLHGVRTLPGRGPDRASLPDPVRWERWLPGRPLSGERVTLVWEYVNGRQVNVDDIGPMPGLNVISPTWFSLADAEGRFRNVADAEYVAWARERDLLVWGLVTNSFDPDLTAEVLARRETRAEMIRQLIAYAVMYELDGINIDFENVYYEDRDRLTQFVRELAPAARGHGLTLSIDVTVISTSRTWSMCYDRRALAEIVDYVILMAYDEHWATSPRAGSVASLPWVESGLRGVLAEVPADRLVLGIPFYTRIWEEWTDGGEARIRSRAVGMNTQREILEERGDAVVWDARAGQHYLEWEEEGRSFRIWIEDEVSLAARLALVQRYGLAGVAAWRRGLEIPDFWPVIEDAMGRWP